MVRVVEGASEASRAVVQKRKSAIDPLQMYPAIISTSLGGGLC